MLPNKAEIETQYAEAMAAIKKLNEEKKQLRLGSIYKMGQKIMKAKKSGIKGFLSLLKHHLFDGKNSRTKIALNYPDFKHAVNDRLVCNYVCENRIAVYTCIIGKYDSLQEPLIQPDNVDYYAITDFEIPESSKWKRIDADSFEMLSGFSPTMKNRYFKMHPHNVFKDYKYSIYIDGNFRVCSDLTEHVNRISKIGFSTFRHSNKICSYEEGRACVNLQKESASNMDAYFERLRQQKFPENFGLLACNILVREHHNPTCIQIMDDWWHEFSKHIKRDQVSLPYVLFKNSLTVDDVATLGLNVHLEYSVEIVKHIV